MSFSTQFVLLCMLVLSGAIGSPCVADERGLPAAERSALIAAAQSAYVVGNFSEAVRLGEELVVNDREAYGILSEITRGSIVWMRSALEKRGDYPTAIELQTELVTALRGEHGRDHWKTKSDSLLLEELQSVSQMSEEDRQELIATRKLMSQCYRQAAANRFDNAKQAGDAAIIRLESLFGSECWQCSSVLNNLSIAADGSGKPDEALRYGRKALAVQTKHLGLQHPDTVLRLNTLASAEMETGNSDSAEQRLNRAIEIQGELGEKDSTTTALLLNNLGELHRKTSRFELAKSELRRAIEMRMSLLGKFHPDTITSQSNLGVALSESGDCDQALELAMRACQSRLAMFGADHLDSAGSLNNVGTCYQKLGDYDEAAKWIRQSVDAYRNLLGEEHPQTIAMLNNLASVYLEKGDLAQALEKLRQTVDRSRQTQHLDLTARCLNQLGSCLREIGDYPTALMHLLESRDIVVKRFGNQSAEALLARHNLADMKRRMGEWEDAIAEFRECHRDFALLLGDSHPKTVRAASGLAHALSDHGELEEASKIYRDVLTSREEMLGLNHPDTDDARNNLAVTLARHGEDAEAERLFNISLDSARSNHGNHHPNAAITLQNLGVIFHRRGQYTEAEDQFRQASQIMSRQMRLMNRSTSDRQRIYMQSLHRLVLDDWCTTVMSGDLQPDSLHDAVLGWKNSTYLRRQQIETEASSEDRDRLLRLNREISSLLRSGIEAEHHAAELRLLTEQRERLERKIISSTSDWVPRSSAEVVDSLDPNTVAIDFFEYIANSPAKELSPSVESL